MITLLPLLAALAAPLLVTGQEASRVGVAHAVACGQKQVVKCEPMVIGEETKPSELIAGWHVEIAGPIGRVYLAARAAKAKYLPFADSAVTPEMLAPELTVTVQNISRELAKIESVDHVVIAKHGDKSAAVQPKALIDVPSESRNLVGGAVIHTDKIATFTIADLPSADALDVVVIPSSGREYRYTFHRSDIR